MGRAVPLERELVFTDASLAVAAARERGITLVPEIEAKRILLAYPGAGVSEPELTEAIAEMLEGTEPIAAGIVSGTRAFQDKAAAPLDIPRDGSDGE